MKKTILLLAASLMFYTAPAQKMTEVKTSELPKPVEKYFKDFAAGAKILKAVKIEDKGTIKYNVAIDLKSRKYVYVFDRNGKFLKKVDEATAPSNKVIIKKADEKNKKQLPADSAAKPSSADRDVQEKLLVETSARDSIRNRP